MLLVARAGFGYDVDCWSRWATGHYKHGLKPATLLFDFAGAIMMSRLCGRTR
ncbi:hypothetical protein [Hymenobacter rubripertinctus]|uniref:hypothetical protein n=1 Tax=Hymenobacter rubripertinctus TaxID=2029981 RepID=UPI00160403F0|nr:hypothetical protein [Hymenobacter rubripertinctus]